MALSFNGSTDYISLSATPTLATNNFSIHAWFKGTMPHQTETIYNNGDDGGGWGMYAGGTSDTTNSKIVGLYGGVTWVDLTDTLPSATWTSCGFKRDSGTAYGYINGTITAAGSNFTPNTPTSPYATIAAELGAAQVPQRFCAGAIAEVAVWNIALSDADYASLAGGALATSLATQPVFYLRMISNGTTVTTGSMTASVIGSPSVVSHPPLVSTGGGTVAAHNLTLLGVGS